MLSVHGSLGSSKKSVIGLRLQGRAGSSQGCVTIPIDVGTESNKLVFTLSEATATYNSQGGIYGSNDDREYEKVVAFSNYRTQWFKAGEITGYRYYRIAYSHSGGTNTSNGLLSGSVSFSSNNAENKTIQINGFTNNINHIYASNGNLNVKDSETMTSNVDKSIITSW